MYENTINHLDLYRLPWTLPDNAISWLEPTAMCNLACDGCYRDNEKDSHLSVEEVKHQLDVFQKYRNQLTLWKMLNKVCVMAVRI